MFELYTNLAKGFHLLKGSLTQHGRYDDWHAYRLQITHSQLTAVNIIPASDLWKVYLFRYCICLFLPIYTNWVLSCIASDLSQQQTSNHTHTQQSHYVGPTQTFSVQCILGYPNLDYPTPQLSKRKISQTTPIFTKAMWVVAIAKSCKMVPSNHQCNAEMIIEEEASS